MKTEKLPLKLMLLLFISVLSFNCSKKDDDATEIIEPLTINNEVNDFVWKGLNEIYLWQQNIPNLGDNKFTTQDDYYTFLNSYSTPDLLFDGLLYQKDVVDKFSYLVDDYVALENSFSGTSETNGLDFGLVRLSGSDDVLGYVRYVANNSNAATKDIARGDFFLTVNGTQLTVSNYSELLFGSNSTYTLGMANIENSTVSLNGKTVALTKSEFTENPILISKVIDIQGVKVGYIMYNQFIADFDGALNDAIADLKSQNITDLVLDLRYNPGGRVSSAIILSSMITGQFSGKVFSTEVWNNKYQSYFQANDPEYLINRFVNTLIDGTTPITTLNLNKVYILTTSGSASASELVINCLDPYIDVVQIGTNTTGKYTASVTLYDSADFGKTGANPNHKYAMQPLVLKSANSNGISDYYNGLTPDYLITYETSSGSVQEGENLSNLGVLGEISEPFLKKALELITGVTIKQSSLTTKKGIDAKKISDTKDFTPIGKGMYVVKPLK